MTTRIIPRLDIKGSNLVKGVQFEGLRKLGDPNQFAIQYYLDGAHELILMDIVASLYGRNNLTDVIRQVTKDVFIPITVGGGLRSISDVQKVLDAGADKVAINTAALNNPKLITDIANTFGSQCMVLSVEAKNIDTNNWVAYYENGREKTNISVLDWVKEGINLGAGEIYVMSVDQEGRAKGCDLRLAEKISNICSVPFIFGGGIGNLKHINELLSENEVNGLSIAHALHYQKLTITDINNCLTRDCNHE